MAGFGPQYASLYEARQERMYKDAQRRQDWMDTYGVKGLNDMKDVAAVAFRNLGNLKGAGFTDEALEGLYLSGDIEALSDMWKRVQKADPNPANLQSIIEQAEALATGETGDDLYSHIKRGLGLYQQGESSDQSKANVFASFLGYGQAKDPEGIEGYSYKDIRRISTGRTRRDNLTGAAANIKIPKRIEWDADDASKTTKMFKDEVFPKINTLAENFKKIVEGGTFISDLGSDRERTKVSKDRIEIGKLVDPANKQYTIKDRISGINKILIKPVYGGMDSNNQLLNEFFELIEDSVKINPQLQNIPNPADYFTFLPRDTRSAFNAWYATRQSR